MYALAFLIISAIIGAGFATGAELQSFFGDANLPPAVIAAVVGLFLYLVITVVIELGYRDFMPNNYIFVPIYFIFFVALTAGMGQIAGRASAAVALVLCVFIIMFGFGKLVRFNKWIMVFVLVTILVVSLPHALDSAATPIGSGGHPWSILGVALIYAGMNSSALFPLIRKTRERFTKGEAHLANLLAVSVIMLFITMILAAIRGTQAVMPVVALNPSFFVVAAVFLSIFTSMMITLFNIEQSVFKNRKPQEAGPVEARFVNKPIQDTAVKRKVSLPRALRLLAVCALAFGGSLLGFSRIIDIFYPLIGGFMIFYLLWSYLWIRFRFVLKRIRPR